MERHYGKGWDLMGKGTDAARAMHPDNALHAAVLDDFKDELLIVFLRRLGGKVSIPVVEVDATDGMLLSFNVVNGVFNFSLSSKADRS